MIRFRRITISFEKVLFELYNDARRGNQVISLNLGGASGPGGGVGGPVGGFTGKLPQYKVAYDETESGTMVTPVSGVSLLDNLNHIRGRLAVLEASGIGGASVLSIYEDGTYKGTAHELDFIGAGVTVASNTATITLSGTGGTTFNTRTGRRLCWCYGYWKL